MMPPAKPPEQIPAIQILRALAALSVVFAHAQYDALAPAARAGLAFANSHALPWGAGVDLFFVISGFIMVHASARLFARPGGTRDFLRRRLIRIVPLYWLLLTAHLLLSHGLGGGAQAPALTLPALASAYLFLPFDTFANGVPQPYLSLGWTLNYEMFFYAVFALFIGLPQGRAVAGVALALGLAVLAATFAPPASMALGFWSQPIVLEFVLGMGIAQLHAGGWRLPAPATPLLLALALVLLWLDPLRVGQYTQAGIVENGWPHLAGWGLPCALVVGAVALHPKPLVARPGRLQGVGLALGDASYALYLVHPFVIVATRKLVEAAGLVPVLGGWGLVAVCLTGASVAAVLMHHLFERPVSALLQGRRTPYPSLASEGNASSR